MKYKFNHRYESDLHLGNDGSVKRIEAAAGDVVDLDDNEAAFIERDSPGALTEVREPKGKKAARAVEEPPANRMETGGRVRQDRTGDPGDAGAMTSADVATVVKG